MKAKVYDDRCIGCGQCEATAPDVFQIGDEGVATVLVDEIEKNMIEDAQMAASGCPTDAIEIKEA
jgi:ferredoxin